MKKVLLLILCLLLCSCAKSQTWDDVKEKYEQIEADTGDPVYGNEVFLSDKYIELIDSLKNDIEAISEIDDELFASIYGKASQLHKAALSFDNEKAEVLISLSEKAKELIRSYYDAKADPLSIKEEFNTIYEEIGSWNEDDWSAVEKRKLIHWNEVEEEYLLLEESAYEDMTKAREVSENELQDLCKVIVDNYSYIENGVNDYNKSKADSIYKAAVILKKYTDGLKGNSALKVYEFSDDAISYVKISYGLNNEDEDYDFLNRVENASKFSLSTWNEITTQLKR